MDDPRRRSLKVVRVLCDGCERASATVYCTHCQESACQSCADQLHVRGRKTSKRPVSRTCKGRTMKDLGKAVGVLALCRSCRARPAFRFSNGEVYPICKECRTAFSSPETKPAHDIVKRAIAEEVGRSKGSSGRTSNGKVSSSRHKHKRDVISSGDDSTGDDATNLAFSRESSAD